MRKFITAAALVLTVTAAPVAADEIESCTRFSKLTEEMAWARYEGVPMRDMMAGFPDSTLFQSVVKDVYNLPDYRSQEFQAREVRAFGNETFQWCLESTGGN